MDIILPGNKYNTIKKKRGCCSQSWCQSSLTPFAFVERRKCNEGSAVGGHDGGEQRDQMQKRLPAVARRGASTEKAAEGGCRAAAEAPQPGCRRS